MPKIILHEYHPIARPDFQIIEVKEEQSDTEKEQSTNATMGNYKIQLSKVHKIDAERQLERDVLDYKALQICCQM